MPGLLGKEASQPGLAVCFQHLQYVLAFERLGQVLEESVDPLGVTATRGRACPCPYSGHVDSTAPKIAIARLSGRPVAVGEGESAVAARGLRAVVAGAARHRCQEATTRCRHLAVGRGRQQTSAQMGGDHAARRAGTGGAWWM